MTYEVIISSLFPVTGKNVASEISDKLCESIRTKLKGRVLGTFTSKSSYQHWFCIVLLWVIYLSLLQ